MGVFDVFGLGQCTFDRMGVVANLPPADEKREMEAEHEQVGGPIATALDGIPALAVTEPDSVRLRSGNSVLIRAPQFSRLVEQQEPRLVQERARDGDALEHAPAERAHPVVRPGREPDLLEQRVHTGLADTVQPREEPEVLAAGQVRVDGEILRHVADGCLGRHRGRGDRDPEHRHRASVALEEAGADLYAPPARRFRQITLPLMMPAVLAGGLLAFSLSLDNTIISTFVSVAGASPWPVYVFSALRAVLRPEIAAVSTLMLLLTLFALGMVALVLKRSGDSAEDVARTLAGGG